MDRRIVTCLAALVLLLVRAETRAVPFFSDDLDAVRDAVSARADQLANPSTPGEVLQKKAAGRALAAMAGETTSLAADIGVLRHVASIVDAAFPGDAVLGPELTQALDGLTEEVVEVRDALARLISTAPSDPLTFPPARLPKAQKALQDANALLAEAADAGAARADRASKLGAANGKLVAGGRRLVRRVGRVRYDFGSGVFTATVDGVPVRAVITAAAYIKRARALVFAGFSIEDTSTGAHHLILLGAIGIAGPGSFPLLADTSSGTAEVSDCEDLTDDVCVDYSTEASGPANGTLTITRLSVARHIAAGTFAFTARNADTQATTTVINGRFRVKFRVSKHL